jgi:hypothetical protein
VNDPEHDDPEPVDALFAAALAAGESRARAREVLAGTAADEQVLASALRRAVPAAFLEEVAATRPWSERPRVLASVVLSPKAPPALSLRLVSGLYWRDLAEVAATARVPAAVRSRAESLLRDGLGDMRLGDRITLARLATPSLLPALLADSERQVTESTLLNPRLREEDLVAALRREDARTVLVESTVVALGEQLRRPPRSRPAAAHAACRGAAADQLARAPRPATRGRGARPAPARAGGGAGGARGSRDGLTAPPIVGGSTRCI